MIRRGQSCAAIFLYVGLSLAVGNTRDRSFDADWRFLRGDAPGAESAEFDDSGWRTLDLPHDWSIEDLPADRVHDGEGESGVYVAGTKSVRIGPFDPAESVSRHFTGNTVGGTGWYRKRFTVDQSDKLVSIRFDGVYMNAEAWINGLYLGSHPHGYTAFEFALTAYLNPAGEENVLAVRVRNEGRNSRWYSGSGIYRHVWLTLTDPVHIPTWGVFVTTPEVSEETALAKVSVEVCNEVSEKTSARVRTRVRDADGRVVGSSEGTLHLVAKETRATECVVDLHAPSLWSPDSPSLYSAEVEIVVEGKPTDLVTVPFGIRKIEFRADRGFLLNGEPILLKGGCIHHDNGPLGAAAIDRAEERKIELLKANGFNAIRSAHNPPSSALLHACDRVGMLVIDEAFDQWNNAKENNEQDYHRFFDEWCERDITSMVRRDRNHPSVIMWSIGNEIPEQFRAEETQKRLRKAVLAHDATRPVTQAICSDWGDVFRNWDERSGTAFAHLDVGGYNYLPEKYPTDHVRHPERVMFGSESYPKDAFSYWEAVENQLYVVGDFVWTAMDYLGEAGLAHSVLSNEPDSFFMPWPWFGAWSGDLDICGFKKPQSFYRDVVWRRSEIEMAVHVPVPEGVTEIISGWGWPDEARSWNWPGMEGRPLQVMVYTRCDRVRLELNGRVVGEKVVSEDSHLTASFDVPYTPGELRAFALRDGKVVAETILKTSGEPKLLKLTADRASIRASRNDLAYVTVEVVDGSGQRVPNAELPVRLTVAGVGELAGQANGSPNKPASFKAPLCTTRNGRCLVILRPRGEVGIITIEAKAAGIEASWISVQCTNNEIAEE